MTKEFNNGKIILGDCLETLKALESNSVDSVITSPPYYQLRNYGFTGQWGLESDYNDYLDKMIDLMRELKRVLKPTGTMWINLGDTYAGSRYGNDGPKQNEQIRIKPKVKKIVKDLPNKSLMLIPHRFAIRCIDELGLILRNDIIWAKPNGMPESVTDRFSKKHEFMFFFTKEPKYYFDLNSVKNHCLPLNRWGGNKLVAKGKSGWGENTGQPIYRDRNLQAEDGLKNPGDVADFWEIPTKPSKAEHYASYNTDLIRKPIIAGSPMNGLILDPFAGTGTTAIAAMKYDRRFIMIEANPKYYEIMVKNINSLDANYKLEFEKAV